MTSKPENVFLTENRRDVLNAESEWSEASVKNEKSRIKNRATLALDELIEVAESPVIDNTDVFDTEKVARLIHALLTPDVVHTEGGGLYPGTEDLPDELTVTVSDEYQQYQDRLYVVLDDPMHSYRDSRFPDPDE